MKLIGSLFLALAFLAPSVGAYAEDKPAAEKPAEGGKKAKKSKKAKKAEGEAAAPAEAAPAEGEKKEEKK